MLQVRNLTCGYDSKFHLSDINLDVRPRQKKGKSFLIERIYGKCAIKNWPGA